MNKGKRKRLKARRKKERETPIQAGSMKGSYHYFINFKRDHPTYDNVKSDIYTCN